MKERIDPEVVALYVYSLLIVVVGNVFHLIDYKIIPVSSYFIPNQFEVFGYIIGITGGVLTLVGLITIFVAINSQHNIQKCREIIWELIELQRLDLPFEERKLSYNRKIKLYCSIIDCQEEFTVQSIKISRATILVVAFIWSSLNLILSLYEFSILEYIITSLICLVCIFILTLFYRLIGQIKDTAKIGKLPSIKEITNVSYSSDFEPLRFLIYNSKLELNLASYRFDSMSGINFKCDGNFWNYNIQMKSIKVYVLDSNTRGIKTYLLNPDKKFLNINNQLLSLRIINIIYSDKEPKIIYDPIWDDLGIVTVSLPKESLGLTINIQIGDNKNDEEINPNERKEFDYHCEYNASYFLPIESRDSIFPVNRLSLNGTIIIDSIFDDSSFNFNNDAERYNVFNMHVKEHLNYWRDKYLTSNYRMSFLIEIIGSDWLKLEYNNKKEVISELLESYFNQSKITSDSLEEQRYIEKLDEFYLNPANTDTILLKAILKISELYGNFRYDGTFDSDLKVLENDQFKFL